MKKARISFAVIISLISLLTGTILGSLSGGGIFDFVKKNHDENTAIAVETEEVLKIGELWNSQLQTLDVDNINLLYQAIAGTSDYDEIYGIAQNTLTATDIHNNAGKDIVVKLGGLDWDVVYLSSSSSDYPTLTLMLSAAQSETLTNNVDATFAGGDNSAIPVSDFFGITDNKLNSFWNLHSSLGVSPMGDPTVAIPFNIYGASFINSVTLNNGGVFSFDYNTPIEYASNKNSIFAPFTMEDSKLKNFLATPSRMPWQNGGDINSNYPNAYLAYSGTTGYTKALASNQYYSAWAYNRVWLPSASEVGLTGDGIWGLTDRQKNSEQYWLRTTTSNAAPYIQTIPYTYGYNSSTKRLAVRPAIHLSLGLIYEYMYPIWDDHTEVFTQGDGTVENPYIIDSAQKLAHLSVISKMDSQSGKHFQLNSSIDLKNYEWTGIGSKEYPFAGVFDGNYYQISNMRRLAVSGDSGLFNNLSGEVKKLFLSNSIVMGYENSGGISGSGGTISNCTITNVDIYNYDESGNYCIGGIVGKTTGVIENCTYMNGNISAVKPQCIGGIVGGGDSSTQVKNCAVINMANLCTSISAQIIAGNSAITKVASYGEIFTVGVGLTKVMYGSQTEWGDWCYSLTLNGGYPIQASMLAIGDYLKDSQSVYSRLKALGF